MRRAKAEDKVLGKARQGAVEGKTGGWGRHDRGLEKAKRPVVRQIFSDVSDKPASSPEKLINL